MHDYQREFLEFAIARDVLRFGEFVLKSGRVSPYFFNAGLFHSGAALARLGRFYAAAIVQSGLAVDGLFGPAYKGIPLVSTVAVALADHHGLDLPWSFNRKEAKDHGEGGDVVGNLPRGRVLIVDDVISAGTAVGESMALLEAAGATPVGVAIALDRQERGSGVRSAVAEVAERYGVPVVSIVTLDHLLAHLEEQGRGQEAEAIRAYRARYGAAVTER